DTSIKTFSRTIIHAWLTYQNLLIKDRVLRFTERRSGESYHGVALARERPDGWSVYAHDFGAPLSSKCTVGANRQRAGTRVVAIAAKNYWSNAWRDVQSLGIPAFAFIFAQLIGGLPLLPYALLRWHSDDFFRFVCFLTVALCASVLKVRLPGIKATMSANFIFILVGILELSYSSCVLLVC